MRIKYLTKKHQELLQNNNFLNSQNYVLWDYEKYFTYRSFFIENLWLRMIRNFILIFLFLIPVHFYLNEKVKIFTYWYEVALSPMWPTILIFFSYHVWSYLLKRFLIKHGVKPLIMPGFIFKRHLNKNNLKNNYEYIKK